MRYIVLFLACAACGGSPFEAGAAEESVVETDAGRAIEASVVIHEASVAIEAAADAPEEPALTPAQMLIQVPADTSHCVGAGGYGSAHPSTVCGGSEPFTVMVGTEWVPCASIMQLVQCPIGSQCNYPLSAGGTCVP